MTMARRPEGLLPIVIAARWRLAPARQARVFYWPTPMRSTFAGFSQRSGSLDWIESFDVFDPAVALGLKTTATVQDWPGARVVVRAAVRAKGFCEGVPVSVMVLRMRSPVPSFVDRDDWGSDRADPDGAEVQRGGVTVMSGTDPAPTATGAGAAQRHLHRILAGVGIVGRDRQRRRLLPVAVGLKTTDTVQDWPGASVVFEQASEAFT